MNGKLFIGFVSLIFTSYIDKAVQENDLYDKYTMQELFYELEGIERNYLDGCEPFISELTDKQKKLYKIFGVPAPEE
jgi:hypothetical protein